MTSSLSNFLDSHRTTAKPTQVGMDFMMGGYSIHGRDDTNEFWKVYAKHDGQPACLLELSRGPEAFSPVRADIDILLGPEARQDADVLKTIGIYRDVLSEIVPDATGKALTCILLDKTAAGGKHGFHIHFPFISLKNADQSSVLTPMVRDRVARAGLFFKCEYDVDDIAMKPWLVYGSAKSRDAKPYMVTRVFDCRGKKIRLTAVTGSKYPHTRTLPKLLSLYTETDTEYKVSPKFRLPPRPIRRRVDALVDIRETYDTILGLLERLDPERCSRYSDWIGVGKSIYGATGGDGFGLWDDWSRGAHNYRSDVMRQKWRSFSCTEASIGTLRWMARQDDPKPARTPVPTRAACATRATRVLPEPKWEQQARSTLPAHRSPTRTV